MLSTVLLVGERQKILSRLLHQSSRTMWILTKTERLMMSNRPKNPANARNKNVLIIGGSGSGKTSLLVEAKPSPDAQFLCGH